MSNSVSDELSDLPYTDSAGSPWRFRKCWYRARQPIVDIGLRSNSGHVRLRRISRVGSPRAPRSSHMLYEPIDRPQKAERQIDTRSRHARGMKLAQTQPDVAVNYVSSDHLAKDVVDQIEKKGRRAILAQGDVADYADTDRMAQLRGARLHRDRDGDRRSRSGSEQVLERRSPGPASTSAPRMATTLREPSSASTAAYSCSVRQKGLNSVPRI
jgi:hypothetical protein